MSLQKLISALVVYFGRLQRDTIFEINIEWGSVFLHSNQFYQFFLSSSVCEGTEESLEGKHTSCYYFRGDLWTLYFRFDLLIVFCGWYVLTSYKEKSWFIRSAADESVRKICKAEPLPNIEREITNHFNTVINLEKIPTDVKPLSYIQLKTNTNSQKKFCNVHLAARIFDNEPSAIWVLLNEGSRPMDRSGAFP